MTARGFLVAAPPDEGDRGFRGYLGGGRWQTSGDHTLAGLQRSTAVRAMFEFMPADEHCRAECPKCEPRAWWP